MDNFNIRITRRTESGDRAHEESIDIDCGPRPLALSTTTELRALPSTSVELSQTLDWSETLCAGERVNHARAVEACAARGEGWRLPTRIELLSLVDDTRSDPAIDTDRFPDTKSGAYWASTPLASDPSCAWIVSFDDGDAYDVRRDDYLAFVRAVRSVPAGQ